MRASFTLFLVCLAAGAAPAPHNRIKGAVENTRRVALGGHLHPGVSASNDQGQLDPSEPLPCLTVMLKPSAEQQAALDKLLADQQDPSSPDYHHWLTPEEYGQRFGVSDDDIAKISSWLQSQGLQVEGVAKARNQIWFSGTAGAVGKAFGTELHRYNINNKEHFANATDPTIPVALDAVIGSIRGLNDFKMKPKSRERATLSPEYTSSSGNHYLSPGDVATVYNVKPLHDAGIKGAGQTIVVPGQSQVDIADIQQFRTRFGLPANDPQMMLVPNTRDPGKVSGDQGESDLDIEWASAVAPEANIVFVYSKDVMDAVQYAINQNLGSVMTVSYGLCEAQTSRSDALMMQSWAKQANAQGMTWINASGDSGGADCVSGTSNSGAGFSVDVPANIPEVTGLGGTAFSEGNGTYWQTSNDGSGISALAYIPEVVWNDSAPQDPAAGGGGASTMFSKPSWQTGSGVPADNARFVPDVSLASSADHDGYLVYASGKLSVYGGTSVAAPVFAGITALLNQYLIANGAQTQSGVGNMNPKLYSLAQTNPAAFHDITSGNNIVNVTCGTRTRNCVSGAYGFEAGPGYDQATGLGSVDAYNLITSWRDPSNSVTKGTTTLSVTASAASITRSDSLTLTATVSSTNGAVPQGSVAFSAGSAQLGTAALNSGVAKLSVSNSALASGANLITAVYAGNDSLGGSTGSLTVTVVTSVTGTPAITGIGNAASFTQLFAPGMLISVFGTELSPLTASASSIPLPTQLGGVSAVVNGLAAPLHFVSSGQVNVQLPYEIAANSTVQITINNNGKSVSTRIPISSAAPGIFADSNGFLVPASSARRGDVISLYLTGTGAVSPTVTTGSTPSSGTAVANLPKPLQAARFTIGGVQAAVQFIGITPGLVGVMQVNLVVPTDVSTGKQPVIANIGGIASEAASLTVN